MYDVCACIAIPLTLSDNCYGKSTIASFVECLSLMRLPASLFVQHKNQPRVGKMFVAVMIKDC
jgi:hypothetical protein